MMPVGSALGALTVLETYVDWDGPRLFACMNQQGQLYLACWIEPRGSAEAWWYVPMSRPRLGALRAGKIDVATAVRHPEADQLYLVLIASDSSSVQSVHPAAFPEEDFPLPGDRLACADDLDELLANAERRATARALRLDVLDARLLGEPVRDHRIGFKALRAFLLRWEEFLSAQAEDLGVSWIPEVQAFAPGSFVIRAASPGASLASTAESLNTLSDGPSADALRSALRSTKLRRTFSALADFLIEDRLSLRAEYAGSNGSANTGELTTPRLNELRKSLSGRVPNQDTVVIEGQLESASVSGRKLVLARAGKPAISVDVPRGYEALIRGKRIGSPYSLHLSRLTIRDVFGDVIEECYQLLPEQPEVAGGPPEAAPDPPRQRAAKADEGPQLIVPGPPVFRWAKRMSTTDAQRAQHGGVPFLRLTGSGNVIGDADTWFREQLFGVDGAWTNAHWGRLHTWSEVADLNFIVFCLEEKPRIHTLRITHARGRRRANSQPATWVHWDDGLLAWLKQHDLRGHWVIIERDLYNNLLLRFAAQPPSWHGRPQPAGAP